MMYTISRFQDQFQEGAAAALCHDLANTGGHNFVVNPRARAITGHRAKGTLEFVLHNQF